MKAWGKTSILSINFNVIFLVSNPEIIKKPKNLKKKLKKKAKEVVVLWFNKIPFYVWSF